MRRDRQMFPPRQLLHTAATRGEAASDLPKRERKGGRRGKEEDERRKEEKSIFLSLLCSALSTPSSPWEQRERARETGPLRRIDKKRIPTPAQQGGPFPFYLEERNPCAVKPLDRPCR